MAGLKPSLFASFLLCCCCCNVFTVAYQRYCRENRSFGQCELYENCATLRGIPLTDEMRNNADCANSGLSGDVVCCLRRNNRRRTTTTPATTRTTTRRIVYTTPTTPATTRTTTRRIVYTTPTTPASILEKEYINPRGLALLNRNKCGSLNSDRVANGINAIMGEFPWSALLLYAEKKPLCGGSVITDRFVLTAGHCIRDDLQLVRLGEHDLSTAVDCAKICQTYEEFGIDPQQKPFIHPDYDVSTKYKDIALIKLDRAIDFQAYNNIKPICLPITPSDYNLVPRAILVLAGWGLTEKNENRQADILQKGLLRFEPLDVCKELYPLYTVDNSKLCIESGRNHTVSCQGDSGSPIFWKTKYPIGIFWGWHYTQIGLVSLGFGGRCGGLTERPFMYENVTDSLAWLTNTILK